MNKIIITKDPVHFSGHQGLLPKSLISVLEESRIEELKLIRQQYEDLHEYCDEPAPWQRLDNDQFIAELPAGLETILGEGGAGLSGGQKQRLAIARAMIKSPACLLLDEATSSLDADSEDYIGESLKKYKSHISLLVIAHRLSTVRSADHIVVLDKGECVASGTHDELLEGSEIYRRFAKVQFIE